MSNDEQAFWDRCFHTSSDAGASSDHSKRYADECLEARRKSQREFA